MADDGKTRWRRRLEDRYDAGSPIGLWWKLAYELVYMAGFWFFLGFVLSQLFEPLRFNLLLLQADNMAVWSATLTAGFTQRAWCWSTN